MSALAYRWIFETYLLVWIVALVTFPIAAGIALWRERGGR